MTEEEKRKLTIEILYIPTDTDQQVYYIGQFTLYYGTTLNNLTKKERQERVQPKLMCMGKTRIIYTQISDEHLKRT